MNMYVGPNAQPDMFEENLAKAKAQIQSFDWTKAFCPENALIWRDAQSAEQLTVTVHDLKCDPACFVALKLGHKKAEVRYDDRGYKAGDVLHMMETRYSAAQMRLEDQPLEFTGASEHYRITHIQRGYGLPTDMVVLSVEAC